MSFNFNQILDEMIAAIAGVITDEWPKVEACVKKALTEEEAALKEIAEARIAGDIDDADLKSQLEDEKVALEAALLVCQIKTKVMAQKAANAAIDVLNVAIGAAIKAI